MNLIPRNYRASVQRSLRGLASLSLAVVAGCGSAPEELKPSNHPTGASSAQIDAASLSPKGKRLAADQLALEQRIEKLSQGVHQQQLQDSVTELTQSPDAGWIDLEGWSIGAVELEMIKQLDRASRDDSSTPAPIFDPSAPEQSIHVIAQYAKDLAERGIDLLVVPIPNRAQIYGDMLPGVTTPKDYLGGDITSPRLLLEMSRAGIEVVDLYPVLAAARAQAVAAGDTGQTLYLKFNPHWGPYAVRLASQVLAERVRQLSWFKSSPSEEGSLFVRKQQPFPTPMIELGNHPEEPEQVLVECVLTLDGKPLPSRDKESPILLLGDSFSSIYGREGGDLVRHLHSQLGHKIDDIRIQNGGANSVWQTLARRREYELKTKKVVIWVFRMAALVVDQQMVKVDFPR